MNLHKTFVMLIIIGGLLWGGSAQAAEMSFTVKAHVPADLSLAHQQLFFDVAGDGLDEAQHTITAKDPLGNYDLTHIHVYTVPATLGVGEYEVSVQMASVDLAGNIGPKSAKATTMLKLIALPKMPGSVTITCEPAPCQLKIVTPSTP